MVLFFACWINIWITFPGNEKRSAEIKLTLWLVIELRSMLYAKIMLHFIIYWLCKCHSFFYDIWPELLSVNWVNTRSRTRQNFEPVHIGPVQNFGPPARNFGPLRAEFAWREWRKTLGGHVANWAGLSGFSPRENKISHTFFIDCINGYSKVSNAHNPDYCHGVFNSGMLNKGWSFSRSRFDCLDLMHFFHG